MLGDLFMPATSRLGQDSLPTEALLQQPAIAKVEPIRSPEFDEESAPLEPQLTEDEEVLFELGWRLSEQRQRLAGHGRRKRGKKLEVGMRLLEALEPIRP
jgi:hypothetical protein